MQLYTIQLPTVSSNMVGYHARTALYAHYHGSVGIYWNSRRARPTNHEFHDRAIDKRRRASSDAGTQKCECPRGCFARLEGEFAADVFFTYPARILSAFLPAGAHLLCSNADWLALTRVPFAAHIICHHANIHFLQYIRSLVWNITVIMRCWLWL